MTETALLETITGGSEGVAAAALFLTIYYIRAALGELRKAREAWETLAGRADPTRGGDRPGNPAG